MWIVDFIDIDLIRYLNIHLETVHHFLGAAVVVGVALGLRGLVRKLRHLQKIFL